MHAKRSLAGFLLSAALLSAQSTPTITEFPNIPGNPDVLTQGPDGALWFAGTQISRITTNGTATTLSLMTCVLGLGCSPGSGSAGATGTSTFSIGANPVPSIITGPDGALWFADNSSATAVPSIVRVTTTGAATQYQFTTNTFQFAGGLTVGPDGAIWFVVNGSIPISAPGGIGRITNAGAASYYATAGSPAHIVTGSDGALWFTEVGLAETPGEHSVIGVSYLIGQLTTSGALKEYPIAEYYSPPSEPAFGIVAGPDGAIWSTNGVNVERITTAGVITQYPTPNGAAGYIAVGSDGALWFSDGANSIGRITTSGTITEYPLPAPTTITNGFTLGSDRALWFVSGTNAVGRITTAGTVTVVPTPRSNNGPTSLISGPDGNIWFIESNADAIGRVTLSTSTPPSRLQITTPYLLPTAIVGIQYSQTLIATGGMPPYTWSIQPAFALGPPPGLSLSSTGVVSGTPTAPGPTNMGVLVTDSAAATVYQLFVLDVSPPNCTYTIANPPPVPASGLSGASYGEIMISTALGCQWSVTASPSWVTFSGDTTGTSNSILTFEAQPYTGSSPRTGIITVAGVNVTITQPAGLIPNSGYMPHLAAEGGWTTTFTLVNKGFFAADTQLSFTDNNGNPLPLPLSFPQPPPFPQQPAGPVTEASLDQTIAPNASLIIQAAGPANVPYLEGSAQMTSAGAVDGFAIFHYNPSGQEAVVPLTSIVFLGGDGAVIPFDNTNGVLTGIAVENVGKTSPFPVILRDDTGTQIGTGTVAVAPGGHTSFVLSTQFPVTANIRGTIEFLGFQCPPGLGPGVCVAASTYYYPAVLAIRYTPPGTLTTVPPLAEFGGGSQGGMFPHIAAGNGWQTTFVVVNTGGTVQQQAQLNFFDNTGNPLPVPITVLEMGGSTTTSSLNLPVAPNASLWIQTTALTESALLTGSAQLTPGVSGFAIYRYNPSGQEAVVPLETRNAATYLIPFDNTNGTSTGIALSRASTQSSSTPFGVPIFVRDDAGNQVAAGTIPVAGNGHISQVLTTLVPTTANIRGTVEFDTPAGAAISVLGIRSPPALTFTTLPALAR